MAKMNGPLEGIRVLDFGRVVASPVCTQILGDLGADVIKIERTKIGDDMRTCPPFKNGVNVYYPGLNRNKKEVSIDFRNPKAHEILTNLIKSADVVVSNFRPGTMENMGFGWEQVHEINPRCILSFISGFGQYGEFKNKAAFDYVIQAKSGFMSMGGNEQSGPMRAGLPVSDYYAAVYSVVGILAALRARDITGEGQVVDVALFDTLIATLEPHIANYDQNGIVDKGWGNEDVAVPVNCYKTKDGYVYIHAGSNPNFATLAKIIGDPVLLQDKYKDMLARIADRPIVDGKVAEWMAGMTTKEAEDILNEGGIANGAVENVDFLFNCQHVKDREMLIEQNIEGVGKVKYPGFPIKLSATPCALHYESYVLGADNDKVLGEFYSAEELAEMRASGAIL